MQSKTVIVCCSYIVHFNTDKIDIRFYRKPLVEPQYKNIEGHEVPPGWTVVKTLKSNHQNVDNIFLLTLAVIWQVAWSSTINKLAKAFACMYGATMR